MSKIEYFYSARDIIDAFHIIFYSKVHVSLKKIKFETNQIHLFAMKLFSHIPMFLTFVAVASVQVITILSKEYCRPLKVSVQKH